MTATTGGRKLKIEFHGLCLFGKSTDGTAIHVFLAQPDGRMSMPGHGHAGGAGHAMASMEHVTTQRDPVTMKSERIPRGFRREFGVRDSGRATMPAEALMSNVSKLPNGAKVTEPRPNELPTGARGSHIVLHGGELKPKDCARIGLWKVDGHPELGTLHFPYILEWTGEAAPDDPARDFQVWHAPENESPKPGDNSTEPPAIDEVEAAKSAAMHFKGYWAVMGTSAPTLKFGGSMPYPSEEQCGSGLVLVSSCPSAQVIIE